MNSKQILAGLAPQHHVVQFFDEEAMLARNVGIYLQEGIERGDRMIVVASSAHFERFAEELEKSEIRVEDLVSDGRLVVHDAEQTLSSFLVDNEPDWGLFEQTVGRIIQEMKALSGSAGLRAYGEMVDILWNRGQLAAATRLEGFWNRLLEQHQFGLFCAYTVDLLGQATRSAALQEMVSTHSHLLPIRTNGELSAAVDRAMNEVLGEQTVAALMPLVRANVVAHAVLPEAERTVLWLRKNLPPYADQVLARARAYFAEECAQPAHA